MLTRMQKKSFISRIRRMATYQSSYSSTMLRMNRSYYDVLKVPMNSTGTEIKQAFIKLSKKFHPDGNSGTRNSDEFVRVCEAYKILYKRASRDHYNNRLKSRARMVQPADISYTSKNMHTAWAKYQASMRCKQFGHELQSFDGSTVLHSKPLVLQQPAGELSAVKAQGVEDICMACYYGDGNYNRWMYNCYMAGFSLVGLLLALDAMKRFRNRHSNPMFSLNSINDMMLCDQ